MIDYKIPTDSHYVKCRVTLLIMLDADYLTAQPLIRLNRSGNCCDVLISVARGEKPVYSDCAVYICTQVSEHMQFSQTINMVMQTYSLECRYLQADF